VEKAPVLVALGSNLGDRAGFLLGAVAALSAGPLCDLTLSPIYETAPLGPPSQGPYLNAVLAGRTSLSPRALLDELLAIENYFGRKRGERWGPRTLDLDLLDYAGLVVDEPGLQLPHPRLHERSFVLTPLADVAPSWRHPLLDKTASDLLAGLDVSGIRRWRPPY